MRFYRNIKLIGLPVLTVNLVPRAGARDRGNNKLRTYCQFKSVYQVEQYCKVILPLRHRAAFAKFRCGVAPLRIETGRFENIPLDERNCLFCNVIESESHALLDYFVHRS